MMETHSILSAILRIIHPNLYYTGRSAMVKLMEDKERLQCPQDSEAILALWPTMFNAISVLSNRVSPFHRDTKSQAEWYDMLVTVGPYSNAAMELPGVNI